MLRKHVYTLATIMTLGVASLAVTDNAQAARGDGDRANQQNRNGGEQRTNRPRTRRDDATTNSNRAQNKAQKRADKQADRRADNRADRRADKRADRRAEKRADQRAHNRADRRADRRADNRANNRAHRNGHYAPNSARSKAHKRADKRARKVARNQYGKHYSNNKGHHYSRGYRNHYSNNFVRHAARNFSNHGYFFNNYNHYQSWQPYFGNLWNAYYISDNDRAAGCHPVVRVRQGRHGARLIGATMCYNNYGESFIVRGTKNVLYRTH